MWFLWFVGHDLDLFLCTYAPISPSPSPPTTSSLPSAPLQHCHHNRHQFLSTGNSALYLREGGGRKNPPKPSSQEDLCHVRLPHAASGFLFFITTSKVFVVRALFIAIVSHAECNGSWSCPGGQAKCKT